eukprot:TRINITY_DN9204_c1_g1_i4.p5 TRINITY_DN9204_c1_g1~~TRINITY_DN9204_c1_g1_i4.p5  ORF type:complete len:100 (+),score=14.33 TRINITY_DN9204_c1_g1_i4:165-464(+)
MQGGQRSYHSHDFSTQFAAPVSASSVAYNDWWHAIQSASLPVGIPIAPAIHVGAAPVAAALPWWWQRQAPSLPSCRSAVALATAQQMDALCVFLVFCLC